MKCDILTNEGELLCFYGETKEFLYTKLWKYIYKYCGCLENCDEPLANFPSDIHFRFKDLGNKFVYRFSFGTACFDLTQNGDSL